jgi:2-haloalkanoic acid dehalogenase type II
VDGRLFDVITFDCYGTLIDWERGIADAFRRAGATAPVAEILAAYAEIEPRVEAGPWRPYRDVLAQTARRVAEQLGSPATSGEFLAESLASWTPFPDTNPALLRLHAAGYRLGILSNVDDELLAGTLARLAGPFDPVVTASQVRAYKPAHAHFREARQRIGKRRWLHAAQSWFHDVGPAWELDLPVAWVNRRGEQPGATSRPLRVVDDLTGLADWLAPGDVERP